MKECAHCHQMFNDGAVKKCPHPAVNRIYGDNICYRCCSKCKHVIINCGLYGCDLLTKKEK